MGAGKVGTRKEIGSRHLGFREWERPSVLHFFKESKPLLLEMKTLMCSLSEHLEMFLFDSAEIWGAQCVRIGFV